jgi:hypothetical protein
MVFAIDTNGVGLPNMEGYDVFKFELVKVNGTWKFYPKDHAANLMQASWKITYW